MSKLGKRKINKTVTKKNEKKNWENERENTENKGMFEKQNNGRKILTRKNIKKNQKEKVQIK